MKVKGDGLKKGLTGWLVALALVLAGAAVWHLTPSQHASAGNGGTDGSQTNDQSAPTQKCAHDPNCTVANCPAFHTSTSTTQAASACASGNDIWLTPGVTGFICAVDPLGSLKCRATALGLCAQSSACYLTWDPDGRFYFCQPGLPVTLIKAFTKCKW